MSKNMIVVGIVAGIIILGGGYLFFLPSGGEKMMGEKTEKNTVMGGEGGVVKEKSTGTSDSMTEGSKDSMMKSGTYEPYAPEKLALARDGKVVLYFHADWCPICRPLDAALKSGVPAGIHILKVDYDTAGELKQKYGVTYQHTFVQVDAEGSALAKWGDAFTVADVLARIK